MDFYRIEKLCEAENWTICKFAVMNLLRADGVYEVEPGRNARGAAHKVSLKSWNKDYWVACQVIVKWVESKAMALLVACETARQM